MTVLKTFSLQRTPRYTEKSVREFNSFGHELMEVLTQKHLGYLQASSCTV